MDEITPQILGSIRDELRSLRSDTNQRLDEIGLMLIEIMRGRTKDTVIDKDELGRGVAGDRCEVGNECGRLGCPECQA